MTTALRFLRGLLAFAILALGLSAPATAWNAHEISHLDSPVALDEHHHHDEHGVQASGGDGHEAPGDDQDGGHDHMPSLAASLSAIVGNGPVAMLPVLAGCWPLSTAAKTPVDLIEPPPARPPRSV